MTRPEQQTTRARTIVPRADALLQDLNPEQRAAVRTTEGPVLILAGAGSGKTRTLTHRVAYLLEARGVPPAAILAVTFTNKAAREMRERITRLVGRRRAPAAVGTFHGTCARILRREGHRLGIPPTYTILDEEEAGSLMKSVITDAGLSPKEVSPAAVLARIGTWKDDLRTPAEVREAAPDPWETKAADLWDRYAARLREIDAVDFDGLLSETVALFRAFEDVRAAYEARYPHLSVDEYQDTNNLQAALLKLLSGTTRNICVVGDDAQAIYGWRGANIENIRAFPREFPGGVTITLEQNYRSTQAILDAANSLIAQSTAVRPKALWTENARGTPPRLLRALDERDEGRRILRQFQRLFATTATGPADAAVLYRTNAQSRALEEACLRFGVPYEIVGGLTFYERREVKDIIAYLRLIQNPQDALAFRRIANVPPRGIGERTVERCLLAARERGTHPLDPAVVAAAPEARRESLTILARILDDLRADAATTPPTALIDRVLAKTAFRRYLREEEERATGRPDPTESRYQNVLELKTVAERHATLAHVLEELALMSEAEKSSARDDRPRLKLMTIHAAKGLEFPIVAVAGLEEGLLPHQNAFGTRRELEEERRLCYVAVTRAREHLFLCMARARTIYGTLVETTPSRFLDDLSGYTGANETDARDTLTDSHVSDGEEIREVGDDLPFFAAGDRVHHAHFGEGTVEAVDDRVLTVRFPQGVKRLDATIAPLHRRVQAVDEG